jgi:hypothetical protein
VTLEDQKRRTQRNFTLQNMMNRARFQINRKTELHENFCIDDEIDEFQNHVCHRCCQRLKN